MLRLVHVLPEASAHVVWQPLATHETVEVMQGGAKVCLLRVEVGDDAGEGADDLGVNEGRDAHEGRTDGLLRGVKWGGGDVAVSDCCEGHHGPVERRHVQAAHREARVAACGGSARRAVAVVAEPAWHRGGRGNKRLEEPDACHPVGGDQHAHDAFENGEHRIVDGDARLPPLGHARRAQQAHQLEEPQHTQRLEYGQPREILGREGGRARVEGGAGVLLSEDGVDVKGGDPHREHVEGEPRRHVVARNLARHRHPLHTMRKRLRGLLSHRNELDRDIEGKDTVDDAVDDKERVERRLQQSHLERRHRRGEDQRDRCESVPVANSFALARIDEPWVLWRDEPARIHLDRLARLLDHPRGPRDFPAHAGLP